MSAGGTGLAVGTRVRVTAIASRAPDDRELVGIEGELDHPFAGLMTVKPERYVAGLRIAPDMCRRHGVAAAADGWGRINLCGDDGHVAIP